MMDQKWFEMLDVRRRKFDSAVWIPLRAAQILESTGKRGCCGFREEFFGAASIAVPLNNKASAETLGWEDIGLRYTHIGGIDERRYVPADVFDSCGSNLKAIALVLAQNGNGEDLPEWHLH